MNPHGVLICCLSCGRDTRSKSGYCTRCTSHRGCQMSDQKGRPARSAQLLGGTPLRHDGDFHPEERED
jgi:hypothetical protein